MIVAIEGKATHKEPTLVHVRLNSGLTYGVFISLQTSGNIKLDENISLFTTHIVREDAQLLYGFSSKDEQAMFKALLKVNGVGANTALAVCSTLTPKGFSEALVHGSIESFKKVPGIGPKTAKRILVELSEFSLNSSEGVTPIFHEASLALESLGFKKDKISSVLKTCNGTNTAEIIKQALKKLS